MRKPFVFILLALAYGCSASNPDTGALGNGKFGYVCSAQGFADAASFDTQCAPGVFSAPNFVPAAIAVGSTFTVTYKSNKSTSGNTDTVIPSAPSIVALTGGHFEALRAGNVALIGMHEGEADDFEYVKIAPVATIELALESSTSIAASPMSSEHAVLGGKLNCTWTWSSPDAFVVIKSTGRKASVIGPSGLSTMVTATCGAQSGSLLVHLVGGSGGDAGVMDGSSTTDGSSSSDASSDASTDAPSDGGTNG